jgi:two-component system sensor histidine kinase KdpD
MKTLIIKVKTLFASPSTLLNIITTCGLLMLATAASFFFFHIMPGNSATIALIYILALVLIARFTSGYIYGVIASLAGVICVNYLFTYPFFQINFTLTGYPVTFLCMLGVSLITSATTYQLKKQAKILSEREKLLMEAEKEKVRANLLRAVSHDLRTPLTSIIGASSSYLHNHSLLSEKEQLELIEHIYEDSNWLLNMVENLLTVTRMNNNLAGVTKSLEPVEEVVAEAVLRLKKRIPNANITLKVPDEFLMIPMDATLIEQVLINLLENALVHSQSDKPVFCNVEEHENDAVFSVIDHGIGIPEDKLESIFDGAPSTTVTTDGRKGMGIGLSICKSIILAHGGTIKVKNHEQGAEFYFTLPKDC